MIMMLHESFIQLLVFLLATIIKIANSQTRNCNLGYFDDGNICMPCPQGTYKSESGPGGCTSCEPDSNGRPGSTRGTGATDDSACFFRPYVIDFYPKSGPIAGGTKISIFIGYIMNRRFFRLKIAGVPAEIATRTEEGMITYTGRSTSGPKNGTIMVELVSDVTEFRIESEHLFTYKPNPSVKYIENLNSGTIVSGGIELVVHGERLTVVETPMMLVTRVYKQTYKIFKSPCDVLDDFVMTCITPDLTEGIDMKEIERSRVVTTLTDNPQPSNSQPGLNKGTSSNCTYSNVTRLLPDGSITTELTASPGCPKQPLQPVRFRRKRDISDKPSNAGPLNNNELNFYIGFQFDGLTSYNNFTTLPVYEDPLYYKFEEADHIRLHSRDTLYLNIKGERLTQGVQMRDITVRTGASFCNITTLATNALICKPPQDHPGHGNIEGPANAVLVEVQVGNLQYFIGYLQYAVEASSSSETTDYVLIIITSISVLFIWIICIWVACTYSIRNVSRRRKSKRVANRERLKKVISSGSSSTEAGDYLYPTDSSDNTGSSTASGGFDNITVIPMYDIMNDLDPELKGKIEDCQLSSGNLRLDEPIGSGTFGRVYKGHLNKEQQDMVVAVKTLRNSNVNEKEITIFLKEALVMKGFKHPNILPLYGVVIKDYLPLVVFEFMDNGDLKSYMIKNKRKMQNGIQDLVGFGLQVSDGMSYLSKEGFVHRDLAARNCLINADKVVKIGDFGLSRDIHGQDYYRVNERGRPLPVKWMAAESLNYGKFTSKSDIWSYGVLLWEVMSRGLTPYQDVDNSDMKDYINQGYRLSKPTGTPHQLYELMKQCWNEDPNKRPDFSNLSQTLKQFSDENLYLQKGD